MIEVNMEGKIPKKIEVKRGTSLLELKNELKLEEDPLVPIVGVLYNKKVMGLDFRLNRNCDVRYITTQTEDGADIYRRSLSLLLHAAFIDKLGCDVKLKIEHSLSKGYFYTYMNDAPLTEKQVKEIEHRMREMVNQDIPIEKDEYEVEDALDIFERMNAWDRYYLLKYSDRSKVVLYRLRDCINLAQGPLVFSTGYLRLFALRHFPPGIILMFPQVDNPKELPPYTEQKRLYSIYSEQREWSKILDVDSAGKLNRLIVNGKIDNLIWVSEGLHEKKVAQIADIITKNALRKRIVLLAGPSSSGKTTFAKRLTIQLLANGINPEVLSLDNYFLPRDQMPRDKNGKIDFDSLYALDIDLINSHLNLLLKGKEIKIPKYDFKTGKRTPGARDVRIEKNQIVIVEGIHGMNEKLTGLIAKDQKFKIYISALTQLNLDYINRIPTSTVRMIRRIVRDYQFRGHSAQQTIKMWPLVRAGEEKNIFSYQEDVDIMFNSSLVYEMSVLKGYVEPLLKDIEDTEEAYTQARKLLHFTSNFLAISPEYVPLTSILREFIGGSAFKY